jgi:hypothetical protein
MSTRDVSDLQRWMESSSDAPPELRAAIAELAESSHDGALLARLEARLEPLWVASADAAEPPSAPPEAASVGPSAASTGASATGLSLKLGGLVLLATGAIAAALGASRDEPRKPTTLLAPPMASIRGSLARATTDVEALPAATSRAPTPRTSGTSAAPARPSVHRTNPVLVDSPASGVAEEARLLRSAREATGTSLDRALSLLAEHERKFPRGELRDERELFAIDMLTRAGRSDEAVARVERLRRTSPGSPHLIAAERLVSKTSGPR